MSEPKMMSPIDISFQNVFTEVVLPKFSELGQTPVVLSHTPLTPEQTRILTDHGAKCLPSILSSWKDLSDTDNIQKYINLSNTDSASVDLLISFDTLDFVENMRCVFINYERVLRSGGFIMLSIKKVRILDKDTPPFIDYIANSETYGLPMGSRMPSMKVGRGWILTSLEELGLIPECYTCSTETTGKEPVEWISARKPRILHQRSIINERAQIPKEKQKETIVNPIQKQNSTLGTSVKSKAKSKRRYNKIKKFGK